MQSAVLISIASSLGVTFGWQPMPDGSPSYEYVVQLDQELLANLKLGDSIPISSDVPQDIRPIARIRIVVGDDELPRQKLMTHFKPWPEGESREGIVETQYVVPPVEPGDAQAGQDRPILPADRAAQQILPRNSNSQPAADSFGKALPQQAEQERNASRGNILPPSRDILPRQTGPRYADSIPSGDQSTQADIRQLFGSPQGESRPTRLQPVDERSIVRQRSREPDGGESGQISPRSQLILPRGNAPIKEVEEQNASTRISPAPRYGRVEEPVAAADSRNRNQSQASQTPVAETPSALNAPWPAPKRFEDAPLAQQWDTQNEQQNDRYATPPDNNSHSPPPWPKPLSEASSSNVDSQSNERSDQVAGATTGSGQHPAINAKHDPSTDTNRPSNPLPVPEIRREMLNQPADAELQNANREPVPSRPFSLAQNTVPARTERPQSTVISSPQPAQPASGGAGASLFPLLLAWVLLSGSGAGNLYLIWSYLDIRHKYRGPIRSAGRKLGRRSQVDEYEEDYED